MMKAIISFLFSLFILSAFGQTINDTIWYTRDWKRTTYTKVKAIYGIKDYDETGRGMATYYLKDGTLHSHQNEYKDLKDGLCIWYYSDGKKSTEANYIRDTLNGELRRYNEEEQLKYVEHYEMGAIKKRWHYDSKTGRLKGSDESISDFPDKEAEFNGGMLAMQKWISENIEYPKEALVMNEQGRVYLGFIIETNGEISTIEIVRGVSESLDEEAIRVVESMPAWIPAEASGKRVRTRVRLPINFTLTTGKEDKKRKRRNKN